MKISLPHALWLCVCASAVPMAAVAAQEEPPVIVQPGAPGESTRTLSAEEVASIRVPGHVDADVRFMQGMIHHHAQALEMTALLYDRTASEEMRLLAQRIDISQTDEIKMMQGWLGSRGEDAPMLGEHYGMATDHAHMPGMLSSEQMARLASANGSDFDELFLELMIGHHEGALAMVHALFSSQGAGQEPDVFQFAFHVDADQYIEIERMEKMLRARR